MMRYRSSKMDPGAKRPWSMAFVLVSQLEDVTVFRRVVVDGVSCTR